MVSFASWVMSFLNLLKCRLLRRLRYSLSWQEAAKQERAELHPRPRSSKINIRWQYTPSLSTVNFRAESNKDAMGRNRNTKGTEIKQNCSMIVFPGFIIRKTRNFSTQFISARSSQSWNCQWSCYWLAVHISKTHVFVCILYNYYSNSFPTKANISLAPTCRLINSQTKT